MKNNINPIITDNNIGEINLIDTLAIDKKSLIFKDSVSGEVLDKESLAKSIEDSEDNKLPKAIHVDIEATHSGITKNYTEYIPDNMERSANTWTNPYKKPVLEGHKQNGKTLGRVIAYEYKTSILNPEKKTIKLTLEITDPDSIRRHLDGTALTYSIGAQAKEVFCSICGIDIINSDSWCGHWKGDKYKIKKGEESAETTETCIWKIGDMEYIEVSEVNVPADVWAQTLDVRVKEEDKLKDTIEQDDVETQENNKGEDDIFDIIDNLVDNDTSAEENSTITDKVEENIEETNNTTDEVTKLTEAISVLENDKKELAESIVNITKEKDELNTSLTEIKDKLDNQKKINISLSTLIKKVYTENILNAKIRLGDITKEQKTEEADKLMILSSQELASKLEECIDKELNTPTSLPTITQASTGALGVYQDNVDSESRQNKKADKKEDPYSLEDAINGILDN